MDRRGKYLGSMHVIYAFLRIPYYSDENKIKHTYFIVILYLYFEINKWDYYCSSPGFIMIKKKYFKLLVDLLWFYDLTFNKIQQCFK